MRRVTPARQKKRRVGPLVAEGGARVFGAGESPQKGSPAKLSGAVSLGRGGSTERGSFRPLSEAMDAQSLPTRGQAEPSSDFVGLAPPETGGFRAEARTHFKIGGMA